MDRTVQQTEVKKVEMEMILRGEFLQFNSNSNQTWDSFPG